MPGCCGHLLSHILVWFRCNAVQFRPEGASGSVTCCFVLLSFLCGLLILLLWQTVVCFWQKPVNWFVFAPLTMITEDCRQWPCFAVVSEPCQFFSPIVRWSLFLCSGSLMFSSCKFPQVLTAYLCWCLEIGTLAWIKWSIPLHGMTSAHRTQLSYLPFPTAA